MNIIFGVYHQDGAPVEGKLQTMQQALASFAPGRTGVWDGGWLGMGCLHLPGTPEAKGEQLPVCDGETQSILTAGARLDNRDELLDELGIATGRARSEVTDADIILHAYRRWGEDCVLHLDGDWHFAVWDPREHRLFLARDPQGHTALYFYQGSHFFAFASSKKALLALDGVPKEPNLLYIAQVLAAWAGDGTQTAYSQIQRLPPAHRMVISPARSSQERFWFPENVSELRLKSDDEYVEAFLESFRRAVAVRLRCQGRVAVTLSGGMDSSSVTAVAAELLRMGGDSLLAFTAMPLHDPQAFTDRRRFGDEAPLARQTASRAGNVEHHLLCSESVTPLAGIERMLDIHDEPGHGASNQYWLVELLEAARQQGAGALLTGQMGNATISWTGGGENLLPLLWGRSQPDQNTGGGHFWQAFEAARAAAGLGRWRAARRFLLKPLIYRRIANLRRRYRLGSRAWRDYSAIRPEFTPAVGLEDAMAQAGYLPGFIDPDPLQHRLAIIQPGQSILGASWFEKGAAFGLEVRDPTLDRRLVELCLAIPEGQFQRGGVDRWLIRRAMQGYLPDAVRLNTRRGLQAADLGARLLASREEIETGLARLERHSLARQVLDLPRMRSVLTSLERGLTPRSYVDCSTILLRGMMAGFFLLRFQDS